MPEPAADSAVRAGVLTAEIDGGWTVGRFAGLLAAIDAAYRAELRVSWVRERHQSDMFENSLRSIKSGRSITALIDDELTNRGELALSHVAYASPGVVKVIAALNPLKAVSDGVGAWRGEHRAS